MTNTPNDELIVKKNPDYWQAGHPYLDQITFKTVGSDEAAYEAMLANQGQVYEDMSTTQLITESAAHFEVENNLGTSPYDLQLNTAVPPFNNPKARQAIYAATNFQPILQHLFGGRYPIVQGFTGPGGICYEQYVPGYQGYDPTLAKTLIQQTGLDKTTIQLGTIALSTAQESMQALATEWEALGLHVKQSSWPLSGLITAFEANGGKSWQSMVQTAGAYDPAAAIGVDFRFNSLSPFSGVHDPQLDKLLLRGAGLDEPVGPVRLLRSGGRVHRQELLRAVLLRVLPGEHLGARRRRARPYHAAGLRRGRADDPVGGRVLQPVEFLTADPESRQGGHKNHGAGSANPAPAGGSGARDRARRVTGSPALRMVGRRLLAAIPVLIGVTLPDLRDHERAAQRPPPRRYSD